MRPGTDLFGLMAEFAGEKAVLAAAKAAYAQGYRKMDAFTPFPVDGLAGALGRPRPLLPLVVLLGGIGGCAGGYFLQWYALAVSYPLNIGGRPLNSWPLFIPITFELTILSAAFAAVIGMLAANRLPELHHPVFDAPDFARATSDRFFLCIEASDPKFDPEATRQFLESLPAQLISEVAK